MSDGRAPEEQGQPDVPVRLLAAAEDGESTDGVATGEKAHGRQSCPEGSQAASVQNTQRTPIRSEESDRSGRPYDRLGLSALLVCRGGQGNH